MSRWVHRLLLTALLALASAPLQGQGLLDTCIHFENDAYLVGWTMQTNNSSTTAYVQTGGYASAKKLYLYSYGWTFLLAPPVGDDFSNGYWVQCRMRCPTSIDSTIVVVGGMTDPIDTSSFVPLQSFVLTTDWASCWVDLSSLPDGYRRLAFRPRSLRGRYYCYLDIDNVHISGSPCGAKNLHVTSFDEDSVWLEWDELGSPQYSLTVSLQNPPQTDTLTGFTGGHITLPAAPYRQMRVQMTATCSSLTDACTEDYTSSVIEVPAYDPSDCVDISLLHSNKCTPYYGTFKSPYAHVGVLPDTYYVCGRHTLHTDTTERDPKVGSLLRTIPEGETQSVRLGNWNTGMQAEAMVYLIHVDTLQADMLILKYAAVMQDPNHTQQAQPRFRIEMLDDSQNLIAPASCNSYDFIASPDLGWNTAPEMILWKDWTTVGIDLSAYHGQTVQLRLTTFDCAQGAHYGYAYYTLACAKKSIAFLSCSSADSNRVAAPEGFRYRWWRDDAPEVTLSTMRELSLPMDNHVYYCDMGFIGDSSCSVTMHVLSRVVMPEAHLSKEVSIDNCRFKVQLHNRSHLVDDTTTRGQYTQWTFPDGSTSQQENPVLWIDDTGSHPVTLVSGLSAEGDCHDTITDTIRIDYTYDTSEAFICDGTAYRFYDSLFSQAGTYTVGPHCDSVSTLLLVVGDTMLVRLEQEACGQWTYRDSVLTASGVYDFVYTNAIHCDSTYRLTLTVHPVYEVTDTLRYCPVGPFLYRDVDYGGPAQFDTLLATVKHCDSLVHVSIEVQDSAFRLSAWHSVDGRVWADTVPILLCDNQQLWLRDSSEGVTVRQWSLLNDDGERQLTTSADYLMDPPETQFNTVRLQVASEHGCRDSLRWPVIVLVAPRARFAWTPTTPVDIAPDVGFVNYTQPPADNYHWFVQAEEGEDTLTGYEPTYHWDGTLPMGEREVVLVAERLLTVDTLQHLCRDTARGTVTLVTALLQFPNLVTPNGDGINDVWEVVNLLELGQYRMNELWIYDRTGALVYHVENIRRYDQFWNPLDTRSPDGSYYYRFQAKNPYGSIFRYGEIEVLR